MAKKTAWFLSILVFGSFAWFCITAYHSLGVLLSDGSESEYDHNLPRGYTGRVANRLTMLQGGAIRYAQHHRGVLPPMQSSETALEALAPFLEHDIGRFCRNPATKIPFTPNAMLSNRKMGAVSHEGRAMLFYDANPPAGYPESYYVTIKGVVGHVPVADLPKSLASIK